MRVTRWTATLGTCLLVALATGCGGDDEPGTNTTGERPEQAASDDPKAVFASTCGGCHTLADAGTGGSVGPNLDDLKPDEARVLAAIKEGPGSMPENLLTGADAEEVAAYVSSAAGS